MGYYMRYITTAERTISLPVIETALKQIDTAFAIRYDEQLADTGDLLYGEKRLALMEINRPGDDIFEDDIGEFLDMVGGDTAAEQRVHAVLIQARAMVVLEIFWPGTEAEPVLSKIDWLWDWLFDHYPGILQADNEGFYDEHGLIVERRFML